MIIYPAIDLRGGRCVRLWRGRFENETVYNDDPVAQASEFAAAGARYLHVVDLDGARAGAPMQSELIARIVAGSGLRCQVGGGIRSFAAAASLLALGVDRVVLGSIAVSEPEVVRALVGEFGADRITIALDVALEATLEGDTPVVRTHGWQRSSGLSLHEVLAGFPRPPGRVLCTDVGRDGDLAGPNAALYAELAARYPEISVQASGGVGALSDLPSLRAAGVESVVIGKALYERRFSLEEALTC